jgi:hypothetical protein
MQVEGDGRFLAAHAAGVGAVGGPISARLVLTVAAATSLGLAAGAPAQAAPARVVDCSTYSDYPNTMISSARGMTCKGAVRIMKAYRGNISKTFSAPRGFSCRRVSGSTYGGQWRCTRGHQAFRFEFKD